MKSAVILEIGSGVVKIASSVKTKGAVHILLDRAIASSDDRSGWSLAIKELLSKHQLRPDEARIIVPRHLVISRHIRLPSSDERELAQMAAIEALKQVPYAGEEAVTGFKIVEKRADGFTDILLVIVQSEVVERIAGAAKDAGLVPSHMALSSEVLCSWFGSLESPKPGLPEGPRAIINIDRGWSDLVVETKGRILFTRAFTVDTSSDDLAARLAEEVARTLSIIKSEQGLVVDQVTLTGLSSWLSKAARALTETAGLRVTTAAQPQPSNGADDVSYAALLGACAREGHPSIDLLPKDLARERSRRVMRRMLAKTAWLFVSVVAVAALITGMGVFDDLKRLHELNGELGRIAPKVSGARKMKARLELVEAEASGRPVALAVLAETYRIVPASFTVSSYDYEAGKTVVLKGTAPVFDDIVRFITALEKSRYLEDVKLKHTARRNAAANVSDFEIVCTITPASGNGGHP